MPHVRAEVIISLFRSLPPPAATSSTEVARDCMSATHAFTRRSLALSVHFPTKMMSPSIQAIRHTQKPPESSLSASTSSSSPPPPSDSDLKSSQLYLVHSRWALHSAHIGHGIQPNECPSDHTMPGRKDNRRPFNAILSRRLRSQRL